jgi:flagellar basal-body rod modification protein FlgD
MNISQTGWMPSNPAQEGEQTQMEQHDFLKLLIAQISQQDPLNPMDGTAFLAQLAEFSGLEQMIGMNQRLDSLALSTSANTSTAVTALIGKTITAVGDQIQLGDVGDAHIEFELPSEVADLEICIYDEEGRLVRTMTLGDFNAGRGMVNWDGRDKNGNRLSPGTYSFTVKGTSLDGEVVNGVGHITGVVTGVNYDKGYPELLIGDRRISLGEVVEIG